MKRIGGLRRKRRNIFIKHKNEKGRLSLSKYLQSFKMGDRVKLSLESSIQKGMYHPRFYGRMGNIESKKGKCYEVSIADGGKRKTLIVHPVHLKRI